MPDLDLSPADVAAILRRNSDFRSAVTAELARTDPPQLLGAQTYHPYPPFGASPLVTLEKYGLTYEVCIDCCDHVWIGSTPEYSETGHPAAHVHKKAKRWLTIREYFVLAAHKGIWVMTMSPRSGDPATSCAYALPG